MTSNPSIAPSTPGRRLLLVDDDRLVLATLASGLTAAGYAVTSAESAEEAEASLASGDRPDLAILDVRMPGSGGLALAQRLHEFEHIPFMMLSAYSDLHLVAQATASGALGYAVKPQDIAHLVPAIETALARANELQDLRLARQQLQGALDAERSISVAVGIVMMQQHCQRSEAFELLRQSARRQRCKLAALAEQTIAAADKLNLLLCNNRID
ncbi:MAG: response regulator [Gammaproteobacteria bacterium]|uniref:ANTAR domain-containing response regulator n=1 Tax=Rhodoferax sp. TaxID=50421 RepID=UPI0017B80BA3|nr:response regulator [Rhodoferax sp.]MBU3899431.1 response regulator [Gammaproteobacteria bacterium]MBA3057268.1 response regulator [Rhodoferax sp.]MBU3996335.1 response regulator [Gammaproteobacteria bacterium]MBU4080686.1 response regulator [Gammaproteobacteria bacterium]MBU4113524.1 response regulator [Gammaproteobacteria bacterium]